MPRPCMPQHTLFVAKAISGSSIQNSAKCRGVLLCGHVITGTTIYVVSTFLLSKKNCWKLNQKRPCTSYVDAAARCLEEKPMKSDVICKPVFCPKSRSKRIHSIHSSHKCFRMQLRGHRQHRICKSKKIWVGSWHRCGDRWKNTHTHKHTKRHTCEKAQHSCEIKKKYNWIVRTSNSRRAKKKLICKQIFTEAIWHPPLARTKRGAANELLISSLLLFSPFFSQFPILILSSKEGKEISGDTFLRAIWNVSPPPSQSFEVITGACTQRKSWSCREKQSDFGF